MGNWQHWGSSISQCASNRCNRLLLISATIPLGLSIMSRENWKGLARKEEGEGPRERVEEKRLKLSFIIETQ